MIVSHAKFDGGVLKGAPVPAPAPALAFDPADGHTILMRLLQLQLVMVIK